MSNTYNLVSWQLKLAICDTFRLSHPLTLVEGEAIFRGMSMLDIFKSDVVTGTTKIGSGSVGTIYEKSRLDIFRYLYYRVGDKQVAEDLTSEVFIRMIRSIQDYRTKNASIEAWLYQIARNLAIDHHRKMRVRDHVPLEENLMDDNGSVDETIENNLTSDTLVKALALLNDDQREVIVLRFVNSLPIAQVAQLMHKSEDAIKGLQRRGLTALREILTEWEVHYV